MTKTNRSFSTILFRILNLGHCDLFVIWNFKPNQNILLFDQTGCFG